MSRKRTKRRPLLVSAKRPKRLFSWRKRGENLVGLAENSEAVAQKSGRLREQPFSEFCNVLVNQFSLEHCGDIASCFRCRTTDTHVTFGGSRPVVGKERVKEVVFRRKADRRKRVVPDVNELVPQEIEVLEPFGFRGIHKDVPPDHREQPLNHPLLGGNDCGLDSGVPECLLHKSGETRSTSLHANVAGEKKSRHLRDPIEDAGDLDNEVLQAPAKNVRSFGVPFLALELLNRREVRGICLRDLPNKLGRLVACLTDSV